MSRPPDWLPDKVDINGEWDTICSRLYAIYERDFKHATVMFDGCPIWCNRQILADEEYEEGFWHLITRTDQKTKERLFDSRRAERLPWCSAILRNANDPAVKVWVYREGKGQLRTYAWLENWDYVVIVEKKIMRKGEIAFLITAYYVDGESGRRNLRRKFDRREA